MYNFVYGIAKQINLISSNILRYEISLIKDAKIQNDVLNMLILASIYVKVERQNIKLIDDLINIAGLKLQDAAHLVAASLGNADIFVTCDKRIINKQDNIQKIYNFKKMLIINPVDFKEKVQ